METGNQEIRENDCFSALENIKYEFNIRGMQDINEKQCKEDEEENFEKEYLIIKAIEKGIGVEPDSKVQEYIHEAWQQSPKRLLDIISKKRLLDHFALLKQCDENVLIFFVENDCNGSIQLLYECLRQIINLSSWDEDRKNIVIQGIVELAEKDTDFWKYWIQENETNKRWIELLPCVLSGLSERALKDYAQTIQLDLPFAWKEDIDNAFETITKNDFTHIFSHITDIICERWKEYIENIIGQKKNTTEVIKTGYMFIIYYAMYFYYDTVEKWNSELELIIDTFDKDMNAWYENETQIRSMFYIRLTQVFYLLMVRKDREYFLDDGICDKIKIIEKIICSKKYCWDNKFDSDEKEMDFFRKLLV